MDATPGRSREIGGAGLGGSDGAHTTSTAHATPATSATRTERSANPTQSKPHPSISATTPTTSSRTVLGSTTADTRPVCILGLGLIGGSLLRDIAAAGRPVYGWNRSEATVMAAAAEGFDVSGDVQATLLRAEAEDALVVLAVPVPALPGMLRALRDYAPTVGFTDVSSVKGEVFALVEEFGLSGRFVGGHPMAGTADSGWGVTVQGLFAGAVWVVAFDNAVELEPPGGFTATPLHTEPSTAAAPEHRWVDTWVRVVRLAELVGADVIACSSARHDAAVARISHLPHVLAEALALAGDAGGPLALSLAASSFRDGTRVAGTAPALVQAMCESNRGALVRALDEALEILVGAREALASDQRDMGALAQAGYAARARFEARAGRSKGDQTNRPIIRVRPGAPGWIAQLESAESMGAQISIF